MTDMSYDQENARKLSDEDLRALLNVLQVEQTRRDTIKKGLDAGEQLQFDTVVRYVRERTGLDMADALAMIRAHKP